MAIDIPGLDECMYCGQVLDVVKGFEQVVGFRRRQASQVTVPQSTGRWACTDCIDKLRAGVHPMQMAMV